MGDGEELEQYIREAEAKYGYDLTKPYSEKTAELMDKEVKALVDEVHKRTTGILTSHMDEFVKVAELLLEKEVIMSDDLESILGPKVKPEGEQQSSENDEQSV